MNTALIKRCFWVAISISTALVSSNAPAQERKPIDADKARVIEFWTPERRAAAIPRDLVIDPRGLGYLRHPDGFLQPYGHKVPARETARALPPSPFAKPIGGGGNTTTVIKNAEWTAKGDVQKAAGRLLFAMGANNYYVCSGTVAREVVSGRSIILTAAHCVYDDERKAFATNILFIPDQAHTSGVTDFNCGNDSFGCWIPSFGVVDVNWTKWIFPQNIEWDYAFYVVNDIGAHSYDQFSRSAASFVTGNQTNDALDDETWAGSLPISFAAPKHDLSNSTADFTYALGYSYSYDPKFMYCAQDMTTNGKVNWWLPNCGLSGGSSGGPWVQNGTTKWSGNADDGLIVSVNSWGYTGRAGMAGPKLSENSANCVFNIAGSKPFDQVLSLNGGGAGTVVTWSNSSCTSN